jgi:MFS family permease
MSSEPVTETRTETAAETLAGTTAEKAGNPLRNVLSSRDFRLLLGGSTVSFLGDQFTLVALPWIVLAVTHDAAALGAVLALQGLPRAALMLVGGAVTDRLSPRQVMLAASIVRGVVTGMLAAMAWTGTVQLWVLLVSSVVFGAVAGIAVPAENSIVPRLVRGADLQAGNSLMMGSSELAGFVGPTIAGVLIGLASSSTAGAAGALAVDAATFVVCAVTLGLIRARGTAPADGDEGILDATLAGLHHLRSDRPLRLLFTALLLVNLLLTGPLMVGIPLLADRRLAEGATAFGILMSAFSGGNLTGFIVAGALPRLGGGRLRVVMVGFVAAFGAGLAGVGIAGNTWVDAALLLALGLGNGFLTVVLITWLQGRTPADMIGRMMSLMMLASTGLVPLSQAVAGAVSRWSLTWLFTGPAVLTACLVGWLVTHPVLRALGDEVAATTPADDEV